MRLWLARHDDATTSWPRRKSVATNLAVFVALFSSANLIVPAEGLTRSLQVPTGPSPRVHVRDFVNTARLRDIALLDGGSFDSRKGIDQSRLCSGQGGFVSSSAAPPGFCKNLVEGRALTMLGDFAFENKMLSKWRASTLCCTERDADCVDKADIVVVPSLSFQRLVVNGISGGETNFSLHQAYWNDLRQTFYKPEINYTPLVIFHHRIFVNEHSVNILRALLAQPAEFVSRVVIGALESNLNLQVRDALGLTSSWEDHAELEMQRRENEMWSSLPQPLIVSLPYPTAITNLVSFLQDDGSFSSEMPRRYAVTIVEHNGTNWIADRIRRDLIGHPASNGIEPWLCASRLNGSQATDTEDSFCGVTGQPPVWDLTVNSAFCIEPPEDTLTRKHFYLAVLSGCIPVLVDGGHPLHSSSTLTAWPWRSVRSANDSDVIATPFVDYREFAVIYNADDIYTGKVDMINELTQMPTQDPERFLALRRGLEKVAPRMRYVPGCFERCGDAFAAFQTLVAHEAGFQVPFTW